LRKYLEEKNPQLQAEMKRIQGKAKD
jgi:hypothetical protein